MLLGITLDVPPEVHEFVRSIQRQFQEKFGVKMGLEQPPHITLKRPFERENSEPFEAYLSDLVKSLKKFPIEIDGFSCFPEGVVFLNIIENLWILDLKNRICHDLEQKLGVPRDNLEKRGFIFHLTLAYGDVTPEILQEIKKQFFDIPAHFRFQAHSLSLLRNSAGEWLPAKIFTLVEKCHPG